MKGRDHFFQHFFKLGLGLVPELGIAGIFGAGGVAKAQADFNISEVQGFEDELHEIDGVAKFLFNLIGSAKEMGIVLGKAAHAGEAI